MKEILIELADCNYADLPVHKKRLFWCIAEHFMHQDNEKFRAIWFLVGKWASNDIEKVKINENNA